MNNVHLTRTINAPIEQVYNAITKPEHLKNWFAPAGMTIPIMEMPSAAGGGYRVCMENEKGQQHCSSGTVLEMNRPTKVSMTWKWEENPDAIVTTLTISLKPIGTNKTELTLVHEGFADKKDADNHAKGWESCLNKLENMFS